MFLSIYRKIVFYFQIKLLFKTFYFVLCQFFFTKKNVIKIQSKVYKRYRRQKKKERKIESQNFNPIVNHLSTKRKKATDKKAFNKVKMEILSFKLNLKNYFGVNAQNSFNYSLFAIITFINHIQREENMTHILKRLSFKVRDS